MNTLKIKILILFFSGFCISCQNNQQMNSDGFSTDFVMVIDKYINQNPLRLPPIKSVIGTEFSYPCYQVYFTVDQKDSLISIIKSAHFNDIELDPSEIRGDSTLIYKRLTPKGFILYKKLFPIIIFDKNAVGGAFYDKKRLTAVPDSLYYKLYSPHTDINRNVFKISGGKINVKP